MSALNTILEKSITKANVGRKLGGVSRFVVQKWFESGRIPPQYWLDIEKQYGIDIRDLLKEFYPRPAG